MIPPSSDIYMETTSPFVSEICSQSPTANTEDVTNTTAEDPNLAPLERSKVMIVLSVLSTSPSRFNLNLFPFPKLLIKSGLVFRSFSFKYRFEGFLKYKLNRILRFFTDA